MLTFGVLVASDPVTPVSGLPGSLRARAVPRQLPSRGERSPSTTRPISHPHFWGSPLPVDTGAMAPAWKDESGWTLAELLLGLVLSLSIAAASLVVLQTAVRSQ